MMGAIPEKLREALRPITLVGGHYGVGKTNFALNLAIDLADEGCEVRLVDLDIVNPYFRASEERALLEEHGIDLVAPVFSEKGTGLDVPSLTGRIVPALEQAGEGSYTIVDVGGDDAGAVALGRFSRLIRELGYSFLLIANAYRNLVQDPHDALENMREIEMASHLDVTAIVGNSHLKADTDWTTVAYGYCYAGVVAELAGMPLAGITAPESLGCAPEATDAENIPADLLYSVSMYVMTPWERQGGR